MARKDEFVVGLDIGTQHVRAVVAESDETGLHVTGIGRAESHGLRGGIVVNIESTTRAIKKAVEDAAHMAGCEVGRVYVSVGGQHVSGTNSEGVVAVKDGEVSADDQERVLDAARAVKLSSDQQFLQMLPQKYRVDGNEGGKSPIGVTGVRLEARVHVVTAARASVQNLRRCVERADLSIADFVSCPVASTSASIYDNEKELGVILVDIGAGTTSISIWHDEALVHTSVLPFGGSHITNDVAYGLRTPKADAERIKVEHGCATARLVDEEEVIEVPAVGGRPPKEHSRRFLAEIIEHRVSEILEHVREDIRKTGYQDLLASGLVLTGGVANLQGIEELAAEIFNEPVRVGRPEHVGGLKDLVRDPSFSATVGLVIHGFAAQKTVQLIAERRRAQRGGGVIERIVGLTRRVASFFF